MQTFRDGAPVGSVRWPLPLLVIGFYFLAKPFYFFPSGGPQLGDVAVPALVALLLGFGTQLPSRGSARVLFWCSLFVLWAGIVNGIWAMVLGDSNMLKMPIFLLFNLGIFSVCLLMADRYGDRFFTFVLYAVAASILMQAMLSVVAPSPTRRQIIFFNNPNQLGYWSLLSASVFFLCSLRIQVHPLLKIAVALASLYLVALSLSKAALISSLVLFALVFGVRLRTIAVAVIVGLLTLVLFAGTELYENVAWRIGNIGAQKDDNLATRGYYFLWEYPQHLLVGAGQGAFERFRGFKTGGIEFHSTLGSILFSYGVVGFGLFTVFMWQLLRVAGLYRFAFLVPAFMFGVTHQGLRFSVFWALFALVATVGTGEERPRSSTADRRSGASPSGDRVLRPGT